MCESSVLKTFMFLQVQQQELHLRRHLMWSRWFNLLILLQCSICSLYRKNNDKKVTTYLLLPTYSICIGIYLYIFIYIERYIDIDIDIYIHIYITYIHFGLSYKIWGHLVTHPKCLKSYLLHKLWSPHPSLFIGELRFLNHRGERRFFCKNECVIHIWWAHLRYGGYALLFVCNGVWIKYQ